MKRGRVFVIIIETNISNDTRGGKTMKIYELQERTTLLPVLLTIWEDSVRATHHFLSDTEIEQIREYVLQALQNVSHLLVA